MPVLELVAPAKVNLGLRITGRRPDGYHTLDSLFAPLDLGDRVRVELGTCAPGDASGSRIALAVHGLGADALPADASNLAARAAHAFLRAAGMRAELAIDLKNETIISLAQAAGRLPRRCNGRPVSPKTIYRWTSEGLQGDHLEWIQVGNRRCTSIEALNRFLERRTDRLIGAHAARAADERKRQRAIQNALDSVTAELDLD